MVCDTSINRKGVLHVPNRHHQPRHQHGFTGHPVLKQIKDHALKGNWRGYREFHPARYGNYGKNYDNWIVIYQLDHDELILLLVATGSHEILNQ